MFWATGPIYQVPDSQVAGNIVKPTLRVVDTAYTYPLFNSSEYGDMITDMSSDSPRNTLILDNLKNYPTQQIVLLCHRKEHVHILHAAIPGSVMLLSTPDMNKKERVQVIKALEAGTARIVVTTFGLFHKGIDLDTLEVMFLCAPTRSKVRIKQCAGRIMRTSTRIVNKSPIIVDFVDKKVDLLKFQFYARNRVLQNL